VATRFHIFDGSTVSMRLWIAWRAEHLSVINYCSSDGSQCFLCKPVAHRIGTPKLSDTVPTSSQPNRPSVLSELILDVIAEVISSVGVGGLPLNRQERLRQVRVSGLQI
jgi:hypothetical protein